MRESIARDIEVLCALAGMLAGVLLPFVMRIAGSAQADPALILPVIAVFALVRLWNPSFAVLGALALLLIAALITAPEFYTTTNLQDVLRRASILGIVTMGQVLVLITAGLDLSVGAMIGTVGGWETVMVWSAAGDGGPRLPWARPLAQGLGTGQ